MIYDGFMGGMWFIWIFWIAVIIIFFWVILRFWQKKNSPDQNFEKSPGDIIKTRYAKGEITKDEFEQMKKDLDEH